MKATIRVNSAWHNARGYRRNE